MAQAVPGAVDTVQQLGPRGRESPRGGGGRSLPRGGEGRAERPVVQLPEGVAACAGRWPCRSGGTLPGPEHKMPLLIPRLSGEHPAQETLAPRGCRPAVVLLAVQAPRVPWVPSGVDAGEGDMPGASPRTELLGGERPLPSRSGGRSCSVILGSPSFLRLSSGFRPWGLQARVGSLLVCRCLWSPVFMARAYISA